MKELKVVDADAIRGWMDAACAANADARLQRIDDTLKFGESLFWNASLDDAGKWYAHYSCHVANECHAPISPAWSQHRKLRSEDDLTSHVAAVIASWDAMAGAT